MTWQDVACRQGGVISRAQLFAAGLSRHQATTLLRTGLVVGVHPGVYRAAAAPATTTALHWAAALWSDGVISHRTAAQIWHLPVPVPTDVDVTLRRPRSVQARTGVRIHRYGYTSHAVIQVDGLPTTARAATIVDLARTEPPQLAQSLVDRSVQLGWITMAQLQRAAAVGAGRVGADTAPAARRGRPARLDTAAPQFHGSHSDRFENDRSRQNALS